MKKVTTALNKKYKLSAQERALLQKIKKQQKNSWMLDEIYSK